MTTPGHVRCSVCKREVPEEDAHYETYTSRGPEGNEVKEIPFCKRCHDRWQDSGEPDFPGRT